MENTPEELGEFHSPVYPLERETASEWRSRVGSDWHRNPGVAALIAIRTHTHARPRWRLQHPATAEWWQPPGIIHDIRWTRPGLPWHTPSTMVYHFDMRRAYLAAAAAVTLPHGQLYRDDLGGTDCGYYRVLINRSSMIRDMLGPDNGDGTNWITHATLAVLRQHRIGCEVIESWVPKETAVTSRILRPWAERWRDIMDAWPQNRDTLKQGYAQALGGLFATTGGSVYRPDWRHMIIDQVRASILRRILAAGSLEWPIKVDVDSLYYVCTVPIPSPDYRRDMLHGRLGVGERMGNMRYLGIEELDRNGDVG